MNSSTRGRIAVGYFFSLSVATCLLATCTMHEVAAQGLSATPRSVDRALAGAGSTISFSREVAPILMSRCGNCHIRSAKGDFSMATFNKLSSTAGVISAGNPKGSSLITMIESGKMPPKGKIPASELATLTRWVQAGAGFDGGNPDMNLTALGGGQGGAGGRGGGAGGGQGGAGGAGGFGSGGAGGQGGYGGGAPGSEYGSGNMAPGSEYGGGSGGGAPGSEYGGGSGGGAPGSEYGGEMAPGNEYGGGGAPGSEYGGGSGGGAPGSEYGGGSGGGAPGSEYGGGSGNPYGGGSGNPYGGGGPPQRGTRGGGSQSELMLTHAASLTSSLREIDLSALFAPTVEPIVVESGPVLKREAEQAFAAGNYPLALELAFGHMATEYPDSLVDLKTVKYSTLLRRPVWNVRFGVSMSVRGASTLDDPKPIRETTSGSRLAQNGGNRGGGQFGGGMEQMEQMEMQQMEMQQMEMQQMEMEQMEQMEMGQFGDPRAQTPSRSRTNQPQRSMLDAKASEELDKTLGLVAEVVGEEFSKRFRAGDFGPALTAVAVPEPVEPVRGGARPGAAPAVMLPGGPMSNALADTLADAPEPLPMWLPGIVYLGQGASDEIIPLAKAADLDLVLHFDVALKQGRGELMQNISRCRLIHVATGKSIGVSKGIDSREAAQLATTGRSGERAYVEDQLANLLAIIDRSVKTIDLPKLSPEVAKKRVAALMADPRARSLRTLAEIRLYQAQQLIDDAEVEIAFDIIGGPEALMLLHGPTDQRLVMARKWALQSQGATIED